MPKKSRKSSIGRHAKNTASKRQSREDDDAKEVEREAKRQSRREEDSRIIERERERESKRQLRARKDFRSL